MTPSATQYTYAECLAATCVQYVKCVTVEILEKCPGFIRDRGGWNFPPPQQQFPPPTRNFEIEYGYYCGAINISYLIIHVTEHKYVSSN